MDKLIRVLIVDDHTAVRKGLRLLLENAADIKVVGEADCSERAIQFAADLQPDVITTDISHPGMNVFDAIRIIRSNMPGIRIVIVSTYALETCWRHVRAGHVDGFVDKSTVCNNLVEAIRTAFQGRFYLDPTSRQAIDCDEAGRSIVKEQSQP